jgi:DNA-binding NtrC family response regulator
LVVSDSRSIQQSIATGAAKWCEAVFCEDPATIPSVLTSQPAIAVAMVEQPFSKGGGIAVLEYLQKHRPGIRRILLTTANELSAAVGALHRGSAQQVAYTPVSSTELESMLGSLQKVAIKPGLTATPGVAVRTAPAQQPVAAASYR